MKFHACKHTLEKLESYPKDASKQLLALRELIQEVASASPEIIELSESLKWGQPSYVSNCGTAIRIDWYEKSPESVHMYVHCQTSLIETYKALFGNALCFHGTREIELALDGGFPKEVLSKCIDLALHYQKLKHLPLLGC